MGRKKKKKKKKKKKEKREGAEDKEMAFIMTQLKFSFLLLATQIKIGFCVCWCTR